MALHVGITGGIGSGKSYVAAQFATYGVPVYYADDRAKWLMQHDPNLINQIKASFGEQAYQEGMLNRAFLAATIFQDESKRIRLNGLVHPAVEDDFQLFSQQNAHHPYILKEAALLIETGNHLELDRLILVICPLEERINRVVQRDHVSAEQVQQRIAAQLSDELKKNYADFILNNDGSRDIKGEIHQIHLQLTMEGQP